MKRYDLLDLLKTLEYKNQLISSVFKENSFLDTEISILWTLIEQRYEIPRTDKSVDNLMKQVYQYEFAKGNITKTQLIARFNNLKKKK